MDIQIKCKTGYEIRLDDLCLFPGNLKKHSMLEIERVVDSILNDGYLFPITVGQLDGKNYILDGECTYLALLELCERGYNIPLLPVTYTQVDKETIKKIILIGTSTNHCVTRHSIECFYPKRELLHKLAFNEGALISFYDKDDFVQEVQFKLPMNKEVDFNELFPLEDI